MNIGRPANKETQFKDAWIPETTHKSNLPRPPPIYEDSQGSQLNQANWLELNRDVTNCDAALARKISVAGDGAGACLESSVGTAPKLIGPFSNLIALANVASVACSKDTSAQIDSCWMHSSGSTPQIDGSSAPERCQYGLLVPQPHMYDLNLPPGTVADALFSRNGSQFAPITPDKAMSKHVSEIGNLCADERTKQERDEHEDQAATTMVGTNGLQLSKEVPQAVTDSTFVAISTPTKENHNPDKGGSHGIDLNKTPEQKPRRKKHRPKVVTERKPRRTPRSATPNGFKEKRKYVRKKGLNKPSTTPPAEVAEVTAEPTDLKTLEPNKKSCRRALNFEAEAQLRDESSTCKATDNINSESRTQGSCTGGVQSRVTVQLGRGIELVVENTQAGIAYDISRSMNQILKDNISLPERQGPSTPLPTGSNPQRKKLDAGMESNAESKGLVTAHNEHENNAQVVLKTYTRSVPRSPNDSNCSTSAIFSEGEQPRVSKRKYSHAIKEADHTGKNLIGSQYNTLQAYHTMSWVHFPNIYKKRRTEKGQNSSTSTISSSLKAAKRVARLAMRPQNDAEENLFASKANHWISTPENARRSPAAHQDTGRGCSKDRMQNIDCILALNEPERLTKKRSRGPTRVRDLASLTRIMGHKMQPAHPIKRAPVDIDRQRTENLHRPHTCIEVLAAEMSATLAKKKRTMKRKTSVSSGSSSTKEGQLHQVIVVYDHNQSYGKWPMLSDAPPEVIWRHMLSIDAVVEGLQHLDINRESNKITYQKHNAHVPYNMRNREHNALVVYKRDGTVVPFKRSFDPVKKRRPRPKVDLDEETGRVWKLLMGCINSEGIDGTDEEKAKWWEEERRVFRGRADSFIARMHLVQGDRRFSQWKGSVVDSVIGVFLTQNVSDHLSSSAFMSLAAHFPLKTRSNHKPSYEESTSLSVDEQEVCILEPEDTTWNEKMSNKPVHDQIPMAPHDTKHNEVKVVQTNEFSGSSTGGSGSINELECRFLDSSESGLETYHDSRENRSITQITGAETACFMEGDWRETHNVFASQNSFLSSQNSVDTLVAQTAERIGSCSESNSELEDLTNRSKYNSFGSTFMELLQMMGSTMLHKPNSHNSGTVPCHEKDVPNQLEGMEYDNQREDTDCLDDTKSSISMISSSNYHLQKSPNLGVLEVGFLDMDKEETRSDISKNKDENGVSAQRELTAESASKATVQTKLTVSFQEAPRSYIETDQSTNFQGDEHMIIQSQNRVVGDPRSLAESLAQGESNKMQKNASLPNISGEPQDVTESTVAIDSTKSTAQKTVTSDLNKDSYSVTKEVNKMYVSNLKSKSRRVGNEIKNDFNWDTLRKQAEADGRKREKTANTVDSLDWEAVRCADVNEIANTIKERGMNNMLAERIKDFLNRLVREHGSIDLEWLRDVPPDQAKEYLLSVRGLGLKSVECVRLLTLHHLAFPVDTNVGRIAVRLGWVPLQPLPESLQLHLLELYPVLESIQKYLWPRLCKLDQRTLYELHYQMITFGKVFCTKSKPNCNACPMRGECRHFASAFASSRLALPGPEVKSIVIATENGTADQNPVENIDQLPLPLPQGNGQPEEHQQLEASKQSEAKSGVSNCEPIIEVPATPEPECQVVSENDIEDAFYEDPDEIPTIKLNIEEFTQNLQNYMQKNMELKEGDLSKALVALTPEVASIPMPKLKNVNRLRTEHQVYELPDSHPLLDGLDKREPDDPCSYLLAIWTPGETADSIQPPEKKCRSQEFGQLCTEKTCFSCNSIREANSQTVRATLLIPCRTAMRGSFPLNGTYFQVNEVFADHDSSLNPIDVPRAWIWNLPRRTVYFGTSIPTIFKGLSTEGIQHCFWRGFVCVRGFDQKTRAPRPLMARLHFPASKLAKTKAKTYDK